MRARLWWRTVRVRYALALCGWRARWWLARRLFAASASSRLTLSVDAADRDCREQRARLDVWLREHRERLTVEGERQWQRRRLAMRRPAPRRAPDVPVVGWPEPERPRTGDEWYGTRAGEPYPDAD